MAYAESWIKRKETTNMEITIENAISYDPTPPEVLIKQENDTILNRMAQDLTTENELKMIKLIDELFDSAWKFTSGRALRSKLRQMFQEDGSAEKLYYKTFYAIKESYARVK